MNRFIIRNRDNNLHGIYYEDGKEPEYIDEETIRVMLNDLKRRKNKINDLRVRSNRLEFSMGDIKTTIVNKDGFKKDESFKFIFDMISKKRYKLIKRGIIIATSFGIIATAGLTINNAIKLDNNAESTSYSDEALEDTDFDDKIIKEKVDVQYQNSDLMSISSDNTYEEKLEDNDIEEYTLDELKDVIGIDDNNIDYEKEELTRDLYFDLIEKYSNMYGLDADLICAIATQESGIHSNRLSKYGNGLMQIEHVHVGETLHPYNCETSEKDTLLITDNNITDLEYNIRLGCAIYQDCLNKMQGNEIAALQAYNMGLGAMNNILNDYCNSTGKTKEEVLNDKTDLGWRNYFKEKYGGDKRYVSHVLRYYQGNLSKLFYSNGEESKII